jgi:hypothetical protein
MTVYLHQVHQLRPSVATSDLLDAVQSDYLPLVDRLDVRLVGYWVTTSIQGRSRETVAIWELDDYRHLARLARAEYGDDDGAGFRTWRRRHEEWVERTEGLICVPSSTTPTVADLRARGVRAAMVCHETVSCAPYRHLEYPERLNEMWSNRFNQNPEHPKQRQTIGLYYAKWTNTIAINLWGLGETWDAVTIWDDEWEKDPGFDLWNTLGREIRNDFFDRFMVPAPFSTVR